MNNVQQVIGEIEQRQESALSAYEQLTRAAVAGEVIDSRDVESVLHSAGKSTADFRADVRLHEQRGELRQKLKDRAAAVEQQRKARVDLEEVKARQREELKALEKKHRAERYEHANVIDETNATIQQLGSVYEIERQLIEGCKAEYGLGMAQTRLRQVEHEGQQLSRKLQSVDAQRSTLVVNSDPRAAKAVAMLEQTKEAVVKNRADIEAARRDVQECRQAAIDW